MVQSEMTAFFVLFPWIFQKKCIYLQQMSFMEIKNYVADTSKYSPIYKEWIYFLKKEKKLGAWLRDNAILYEANRFMRAHTMSLFAYDFQVCEGVFVSAIDPIIPHISYSYLDLLKSSNNEEFKEAFHIIFSMMASSYWQVCQYKFSNISWIYFRDKFLNERKKSHITMVKAAFKTLKGEKKKDKNEGLKWFDTIGKQTKNRYNFIRR